jgi:hypothetical protein
MSVLPEHFGVGGFVFPVPVASCDYPAVGNVRFGVQYAEGTMTGTVTLPANFNVRLGVQYGTGGTEFTGNVIIPAASNVRAGINYDSLGGSIGILTLPAESDVRATVSYGSNGTEFTGTVTLPSAGDVRVGISYGAGGTEFTGTLSVPGFVSPVTAPLLHSPARILSQVMIDLGHAEEPTDDGDNDWEAYWAGEPDTPDNVLTFRDTEGVQDGRTHTDGIRHSHPGVLIRIRGAEAPETYAKAALLKVALDQQITYRAVTIDGTTYMVYGATARGDPIDLGKQSNSGRAVFTLNATLTVRRVV